MATDKKISELPVSAGISGSDVSILINNGTDYQFSISQLLDYLGSTLNTGATLTFGAQLPQNNTGKNGDVFFNTASRQFAQKLSDTWTIVYTLPETNAADGTLLYGAGLPGSGTGKNADSYINTLTGIFYLKTSGNWAQIFSMQTGPQGPKGDKGDTGTTGSNGRTILNGTGNPSNLSTGTDGDFYINTTALTLFGPKTGGVWGAGISIVGEDGGQGEVGQTGAQGVAGAVGATGLAGPQGPEGATGAQGPIGVTGAAGATGATGTAGAMGEAGPQGPTGLTGPQGAAGVAGQQGAAGADGAGLDYTNRPFDQMLIFDTAFKMAHSQAENINFSLGISPVTDVTARIIISGDGVHNCTFPIDWINATGQIFDNRFKNVIYLEYDGEEIIYAIVKAVIPDTMPPLLVSAVISNANKNKIILTYNELLNELSIPATGDFESNLSKAISTITVAGAQVTLSMASNFTFEDVPTISYNPGGNPIQDVAGNDAITLINQSIINNVVAAKQSAYATTANQIQQTLATPTTLAWGSGGIDRPWSMSVWVKRNGNSSNYLMELLSDSNPSSPNLGITINSVGEVVTYIYNGGTLYVKTPGNIPSATWAHLAVTYDGSGLSSGIKIYVNKALQSLTDLSSGSYNKITTIPPDFQLAVLGRAYSTGNSPLLNVNLCSMYFWNKELSTSDLNELFNNGSLIDPTMLTLASNLISRYEFDGDTYDTGINGYNLSGINPLTFVIDTP